MKSLSLSKKKPPVSFLLLTSLIILAGILETGCKDPDPTDDDIELTGVVNCEKDGSSLQLDCPALPNTNLSKQPDFDIFAWNTFAALNWPALINSDTTKFQRGIPALDQSFSGAKHDDVLVWETFKEKREVFNVPQNSSSLRPWNATPYYGTLRPGADSSYVPGMLPGSSTKPSGYIFNALDETIQVKSEALETKASVKPVYGDVVSPRVWRGMPSDGNPVVYEVKVNYDFYNYLNTKNKYWFNQDTAKAYARDTLNGPFTLPYRTSAGSSASSVAKTKDRKRRKELEAKAQLTGLFTGSKRGYSSQEALASYQKANATPSQSNVPFPIGSVHIKAAWIQMTAKDDTSSYHTTTAQYYVTENNQIKKQYATFGLIGLHIIQRIHVNDTTATSPIGGTFIFATWEHKGNETGFTYSNYAAPDRPPSNPGTNFGWYPHKNDHIDTLKSGFGGEYYNFSNPDTLQVRRKFKILPGTQAVNNEVWKALPKSSVWQNYQLIGTQFRAIDINSLDSTKVTNPNDPTNIGQPLYLANLVIETNEGLQHFQGQPPGTYPILRYTDTIHTTPHPHLPPYPALVANDNGPAFARGNRNIVQGVSIKSRSNNAANNMGGCMGCHGVAQSEGYSFSFVLLGGYEGATTDTQHEFDLPPPTIYNGPPSRQE